jgi:FkbM family methyltransferase
MKLATTLLPDGRTIHCVNQYEVDFSVHEIFTDDLAARGIVLPADGVFFDVGANIGLFALYLRDKCERARIYAYEPMPSAFAALEQNMSSHAWQGEAVHAGLGAQPGMVEFDYFPGVTALSTSNSAVGKEMSGGLRKLLSGNRAGAEVQDIFDKTGATEIREDAGFVDALFNIEKVSARIDTLSNEIARLGIGHIDLLKIDTEGAEKDVLAGIADQDWPKIRQMMVEVHLGAAERDLIERQLQHRGFQTSIGDHPLSQGSVPVYHIYARRPAGTAIDWWAMLMDRAFLENPYPDLKRIQALGPVHLDAKSGIYFILGHKEFALAARAPQMGRDTRLWRDGWNTPENAVRDPVSFRLFSEVQPQMINVNPPDHRRMRAVYEQAFKPSAIAAMAPMIQAEADRLLDAMPMETSIDFISSYAAPLPLRVLRNLFEIPESMDDDISRWSAALIKIADVMTSHEQRQEALAALTEFKTFLSAHIAERRKNPGKSMMDMAITAFDDGTLDEQEMLTNLVSMLIAGHETTVTLIGNGMLSLLRNPDQLARMRADRGLTPTAVDEFLRFEPGGNMIIRVAIEDCQLGDTLIPAGEMVIGMIGAVNRDPLRFENPDTLDVGREKNPQFTFGGGIHICLGAPLARLEAQIAFDALLARFPAIELDGDPVWRLDRLNARGLQTLALRLKGAA